MGQRQHAAAALLHRHKQQFPRLQQERQEKQQQQHQLHPQHPSDLWLEHTGTVQR